MNLSPQTNAWLEQSPDSNHKSVKENGSGGPGEPKTAQIRRAPQPFSIVLESMHEERKSAANEKSQESERQFVCNEVLPPMPILPKTTWQVNFPPKCPLEHITFIQLKKFAKFKE